MQGKITLRSIEALEPGAGGAESVLWDPEVKGFGCRVQRGGTKTYVLHYRVGTGRGAPIRKFTIGKHGSPWTPVTARARAEDLLALVRAGKDPAELRDNERETPTMAQLGARFLDDHVRPKLKPRTAEEYERLIDKDITPALGRIKVDKIGRGEVARFHASLKATPRKANHALAVLSKMLSWAVDQGLRPELPNPCLRVVKNKERKHERFLSGDELARLGEVLRAAEARIAVADAANERLQELRRLKHNARIRGDRPTVAALTREIDGIGAEVKATGQSASAPAIAAIRLLIFTGARLSEIMTAEWSWVDLERGTLRLPDSKTGAKTIHLNAAARAVLAGIKRIEGNPYVITGHKHGTHAVNLEKPWQAVRKAAGLEDVRLHDLRHSFASVGAAGGLSLPLVGALLGHSQPATTARYAHLGTDPVRDAAEAIGTRLQAALAGGKGAEVLSIASRGK
jgi:integrase